jgi:hypothetical protein
MAGNTPRPLAGSAHTSWQPAVDTTLSTWGSSATASVVPEGALPAMSPSDLTKAELYEYFLRSVPRLSHIVTCYNERVKLSRAYLQAINGQLTNLEHLIASSTYRAEWTNFCERFKSNCLQEHDQGKNTEANPTSLASSSTSSTSPLSYDRLAVWLPQVDLLLTFLTSTKPEDELEPIER